MLIRINEIFKKACHSHCHSSLPEQPDKPLWVMGVFIMKKKIEFQLGELILLEKLPTIKKPNPNVLGEYCYFAPGKYKCFCGKEFVTMIAKVKCGHTKSCGCYNKHRVQETLSKGARAGTRLYKIYKGIKQRCYNSRNKWYSRYGGRGIKLCNDWKDYEVFKKWAMENGYKSNLTIDRKNSDLGYFPENCRWITQSDQVLNKAHNPRKHKTPYKGVCKIRNKWYTFICRKGIRHVFGGFNTPEDCAYVYNLAADKYHKEFACHNKLPEGFIYHGKAIPDLALEAN